MDETGPRSLFVVVSFDKPPCSKSILQLDTQEHNPDFAAQLKQFEHNSDFAAQLKQFDSPVIAGPSQAKPIDFVTDIDQKEYIAHFVQPLLGPAKISWVFSHLESSTELYMVPYWDPQHLNIKVPLRGSIFNVTTKTCRPFHHPLANKFGGHVASHAGYLYFLAAPYWSNCTPHPSFERYDPARDRWETLDPFPFDALRSNSGHIVATALLVDTIIFNLSGFQIWAYNVRVKKWFLVKVEDKRCYDILGEAVVLKNTIYALAATPFNLILALSISSTENNCGDLVFKCRLLSEIFVRGMQPLSIGEALSRTRHLCHLGNDNFCLVQSCKDDGFWDYQPIQLTNLKLKEENSMTVTGVCGQLLKFPDGNQFRVDFCFSLPDSKTTALKDCKNSIFDLNPFPEDIDPYEKSNYFSSLGDGAVSGESDADAKGHFIHVRNISPFATYSQLEEALKTFGPLRDVKVMKEKGVLFATVEFESATSKQNSIKASPIIIADCPSVIE